MKKKIVYITSKINKIEKYINNSELTFELNSTKTAIKKNLNSIYIAETEIAQLSMNNPDNQAGITAKIDSIINTIKIIEPIINSIVDVSIYMNRNGIRNNIQVYRRGLNRLTDEIEQLKEEYA